MSIRDKVGSDRGAINSTETIMLIALAVFAIIAINEYIIKPLVSTSKGIGDSITDMNPANRP